MDGRLLMAGDDDDLMAWRIVGCNCIDGMITSTSRPFHERLYEIC